MSEEKTQTPIYDPMPPEELSMPPLSEYKQEYGTSSLPETSNEKEGIEEMLKNFRIN